MNKPEDHSFSIYLFGVISLSFLIFGCSVGSSSGVVQNNPTASSVQYTLIAETETPNDLTSPTPFPTLDEQEVKTKTPFSITPTSMSLGNGVWYDPNPKFVLPNERINDYLIANIGFTSHGGDIFCAFTPLNSEQGENSYLYLWVLCQEYYLDQEILTKGGGISVPVSLQIQDRNEYFEIIGHNSPRSGSFYGPDVERLFPKNTWFQIHRMTQEDIFKHNYRISQLEKDIENQAMIFFDVIDP